MSHLSHCDMKRFLQSSFGVPLEFLRDCLPPVVIVAARNLLDIYLRCCISSPRQGELPVIFHFRS